MKISPLRQRMRGYSPRTHDSYIYAVRDLSRHFRCSPDTISADEVQQWLLFLLKKRHLSSSTCHLYFNGVHFLYVSVLEDPAFEAYRFTLFKHQQRLPDLLSRTEVSQLVAAPADPTNRLLLLSCYACGLRVSELVSIRVQDIDGSRLILQVLQGKGQKIVMCLSPKRCWGNGGLTGSIAGLNTGCFRSISLNSRWRLGHHKRFTCTPNGKRASARRVASSAYATRLPRIR